MARVAVDDTVWRGPREQRLRRRVSELTGREWSMRELVGTLTAVWSICYDQVSVEISIQDVDTAAETDGFGTAMVAESLARTTRRRGRISIAGAARHVDYLIKQSQHGEKSGEVRRAKAGKSPTPKAVDPEGSFKVDPGDLQASRNHSPSPSPSPSPDISPDREHSQSAREASGPTIGTETPEILTRRLLGDRVRTRLVDLRKRLIADLRLDAQPMPTNAFDADRRLIAERLRESGELAEQHVDHVLAVVEAEARATRSVGFVSGCIFEEKSWRHKLAMTTAEAARVRGSPFSGANPTGVAMAELRRLEAEARARGEVVEDVVF